MLKAALSLFGKTDRYSDLRGIRAISISMAIVLLLGNNSLAQPASDPQKAQVLPDDILRSIADDEVSLPRGLSLQERLIWKLPLFNANNRVAPPQPVRASAEIEANDGLLLRWGSFNSVITEIAAAVTTANGYRGGPPPKIYLVVSSASQQSSAAQTLSTAGVDLARVEFVQAPSNSVWMRDYGPRFVNSSGTRGLVDHVYNRPRPLDDAIPAATAAVFSAPVYAMPLTHGGGNFHLFENGDAFMTSLIENENPGVSRQQIIDYHRDYLGLNLTITDPFPASFDSTQHIDMWMLPAGDKRVVISSYPNTGGVYAVPYQVTEATVTLMQARGYQVFRTPGWQGGNGAHFTYANAVVINSKVLICRFNGEDARNAQALTSFQQAFPNRQIQTIDCSSIISSAGAIHCIVMHASTPLIAQSGFED
jgi:agmatine deiminase